MSKDRESWIDRTGDILGSITFGITCIALVAALPIAGAWIGGGMAVGAAAASGLGVKILAGIGGAVCGAVAGFAPMAVVDRIGKVKDPSYGALEIMCLPGAAVSGTFKTCASALQKPCSLRPQFTKAAAKNKNTAQTPAPQNAQKRQPPSNGNTP